MTKSGKEFHLSHVKSLKEKLSEYGIDPFTLGYLINLSSGEKIDKNIYDDMCQVEILGKEKLNEFIQESLIDGKVGFFNPIKKSNLKTGIKSGKKSKYKIVSTLQEDCQTYGLIVEKSLNLEETFQFAITTVSLLIAFSDEKLRQSEKTSFRNYIIKQSEALHTISPKDAAWFIDGTAFISCLKPKKTNKEWISALIIFIFPDSSITIKLLGFINETYNLDSIKNITRQERGTSSTNFKITGFEQNMPQGDTWQGLLNDNEYKDKLMEMIKEYVLEFGSGILPRSIPFIITSREKNYFVLPTGNKVISVCNHEEADTRLVLHASKVDSDVAVVCKNTDVLILMIWAYSKLNITNNWYFKYDHLLILEK